MKINYEKLGEGPVGIVIEMGLGSCLSEWIPIAKLLQNVCTVMIYERAGVNKSEASRNERTPQNIAKELYELLGQVDHEEKIIMVAHSQGGLYAVQFCMLYPQLVKELVLLDPLSPRNLEFKKRLTQKEYQKSGVDKSNNFKIMGILAKLKLGFITKQLLRKAPPFYYYHKFLDQESSDILNSYTKPLHLSTALEEFQKIDEEENLIDVSNKDKFPDIPLILITHSSELATLENMQFGGNTKEFAQKIEQMWQEIMKDYLDYSTKSKWLQAEKSTHYIHLQQPEILVDLIESEIDE